MPRVSGDTNVQAGSAWLASAPPLWVTDSLPTWLLGRRGVDAEPGEAAAACALRATIARSTDALRRLNKGRAA